MDAGSLAHLVQGQAALFALALNIPAGFAGGIEIAIRLGPIKRVDSANAGSSRSRSASTPFAAQVTADLAAREGMEHGLQKVEVFVKGPGSGRETAVRSLQAAGLEVVSVRDVTPQAHNGCRPRKRRRV